jgi:hypothetical protein
MHSSNRCAKQLWLACPFISFIVCSLSGRFGATFAARTEERMLCRCHRPHSKHIAFIGQKLVLFTLTRSPEILFTSKRYGFMSLRVIPRPF